MHVGEAGAVGTRDRDVDHLDCHVRRDDLARIDQTRDGKRHGAGTARELEDAVTWGRSRRGDQPVGDRLTASVDEVGVLGPRVRDLRPHALDVGTEIITHDLSFFRSFTTLYE